jgi:arsenite-transporting ATPase
MLKMKAFIQNAMTMVKSLFGAKDEKDRTIETLEAMKEKVLIARDQLMDPEKTQFVKVLIPTMMSVFETERLVEELNQHLIPHEFSVVNMVNPDNKDCQYCTHRRKEHSKNIKYIESAFPKDDITVVEAFDQEIRGLDMLSQFRDSII